MNHFTRLTRHFSLNHLTKQSLFRRNMSEWLRDNKYINEMSGLREGTYRDYVLTPKEIVKHIIGLVIPFLLFYNLTEIEMREKYTRLGHPEYNFGVFGELTDQSKKLKQE